MMVIWLQGIKAGIGNMQEGRGPCGKKIKEELKRLYGVFTRRRCNRGGGGGGGEGGAVNENKIKKRRGRRERKSGFLNTIRGGALPT